MRFIRRVWADVEQGRNIDLYVTVILTIVLAILNALNLGSSPWASSLSPVVLSLVALSLLNDRHIRMEQYRTLTELNSIGIDQAYEQMPLEVLNSRYRKAKREIRILSTWIPGMNPFSPDLTDLVRREIPIKILLINPASKIISYRIRDHGLEIDTYPGAALDALVSSIKRHKLKNQTLVEIRLYDALPPFYLRSIDDWMLVGLYWHGYGSSEGPMFSVANRSSRLGQYLLGTFDTIWDNATVLLLENSNNQQTTSIAGTRP